MSDFEMAFRYTICAAVRCKVQEGKMTMDDKNLLSVKKNINQRNSCTGRKPPQHAGEAFGLCNRARQTELEHYPFAHGDRVKSVIWWRF